MKPKETLALVDRMVEEVSSVLEMEYAYVKGEKRRKIEKNNTILISKLIFAALNNMDTFSRARTK